MSCNNQRDMAQNIWTTNGGVENPKKKGKKKSFVCTEISTETQRL